jgi:hypothetical protein
MVSEFANTDLMGAYAGLGEDLSLGLETLRLEDPADAPETEHAAAGACLQGEHHSGLTEDRLLDVARGQF